MDGVTRGHGFEPDEAQEDGEGRSGFESSVLSASMDGVIRAWETLGKSEKYRMRHPEGVEVTSMLVLPGGSVLVTGEADLCTVRLVFVALRGRCKACGAIDTFHRKSICGGLLSPRPPATAFKRIEHELNTPGVQGTPTPWILGCCFLWLSSRIIVLA